MRGHVLAGVSAGKIQRTFGSTRNRKHFLTSVVHSSVIITAASTVMARRPRGVSTQPASYQSLTRANRTG